MNLEESVARRTTKLQLAARILTGGISNRGLVREGKKEKKTGRTNRNENVTRNKTARKCVTHIVPGDPGVCFAYLHAWSHDNPVR